MSQTISSISKNLQKHHTIQDASKASPWPIDVVWLWCGLPEQVHCRYTDDLRYSIRSVTQNLPFVRRLIIVVNDEFVKPFWMKDLDKLSKSRIRFIKLSQFIPKQFLPTYNYHTITTWIHRIRSIAQHFIFLHDDMYIFRPTPWSCFFTKEGVPINRHFEGPPDHGQYPNHFIPYVRMWTYAIQKYNIHNTRIQQQALPYRKDLVRKYHKEYKSVIEKASSERWISGQNDFDLLKFTTALTSTNKEAIVVRTDAYEWNLHKPNQQVIDYFVESGDVKGLRNMIKSKPRFFISNNSGMAYTHLYELLRQIFPTPSFVEIDFSLEKKL